MGNKISVKKNNQNEKNLKKEKVKKKKVKKEKVKKEIVKKEIVKKEEKKCKMPTKNNPAMNFMITDYNKVKGYTEACGPSIEVNEKMIKFINSGIGENMNSMDKLMNERQFITMPWTTHTNDQTAFANWLYKDLNKCKSDNIDCGKNLVRNLVYNYDKHY